MQKAESGVPLQKPESFMKRRKHVFGLKDKAKKRFIHLFVHSGGLLFLISFLLGRALILSTVAPFAAAFFAAVFVMKKEKTALTTVGLLLGATMASMSQGLYAGASIFYFLLFLGILRKLVKRQGKVLPLAVMLATFAGRISITFMYTQTVDSLAIWVAMVEAGLSFVLTMIFLQTVPLLSMRRRRTVLKNEEIICCIILAASVLTGTIGWTLYGLSIEHMLSRYLVLLLALSAGATVGTTVGVVTGLILSLAQIGNMYQLSLLALSGLLGGLLREGRRPGVGLGLILATLLIGMYMHDISGLAPLIMESVVAIGLLMITPSIVTDRLARFIPGTQEHAHVQQQYLRKVRDVTAGRVEQFSQLFQTLSTSFSTHLQKPAQEESDEEVDYFLSHVTEKTCQTCFKKNQCWAKNFDQTYGLMQGTMREMETSETIKDPRLKREWNQHCIKPDRVLEVMQKEMAFHHANLHLKKQMQESRQLVAEQLLGVSQVMGDFAKEIQRERDHHQSHEEVILETLEGLGIEIDQVDIYSLEQGNVDIEMTVPASFEYGEADKIIAPILSDILQETIVLRKEEQSVQANGPCFMTFASNQRYKIETGMANAAKGGAWVSGDSYSAVHLNKSKYAIAISDGMGNGERAHQESTETLQLLQSILQSGIEERIAIKSVNSVLALRTNEEMFSTLDLAMIDLQDASAKFIKIGSTPSYLKRGSQVFKIESGNLPIGILREFDVDIIHQSLKAGDLLIMMSDGIFEGPKHVENYDIWMRRKIKELDTEDPQDIADLLMEEVIRTRQGQIEDDMTVAVTKIAHNHPRWSTFSAHDKKAQ
ncbi:stage II sporulation protein E [Aureibacillus halotolerans]|uniref:Stage II sporulation protein E n=1 Tax=Aureibacillus halotolerans TaxID=1508390 RepID=A0A4R6TUN5_9BACI|nr:stage II sporulation protein E [Aureibacillus halotolerans]TDQ34216.1 stage II sporulation protein E [Aureibacillus halotolerans]